MPAAHCLVFGLWGHNMHTSGRTAGRELLHVELSEEATRQLKVQRKKDLCLYGTAITVYTVRWTARAYHSS